MTKEIWFDMDGTLVDLYGIEGWLKMLLAEDETPYAVAKPLMNMQVLARVLNKKVAQGYTINVISWCAKDGSNEYNKKVAQAKLLWLSKHLKSVKFNRIDIVEYGTPKQLNRNGILFDDEKPNRDNWLGAAYNVDNIIGELKNLQ